MLIYVKCLQISCHLSSGSVFVWRGVYFSELQKINCEDLAEKLKKIDIKRQNFFLLFDTFYNQIYLFPQFREWNPKKMCKYIKLMGENGFLKGEINFGENAG